MHLSWMQLDSTILWIKRGHFFSLFQGQVEIRFMRHNVQRCGLLHCSFTAHLSKISLAFDGLPCLSSNLTYDIQAFSSGAHFIHRSKTLRAPARFPSISSMNEYLYQSCATRGKSTTARSHTFLAWLMNLKQRQRRPKFSHPPTSMNELGQTFSKCLHRYQNPYLCRISISA